MKRIAIVGFGFMGKTHALSILKNKNLQLVSIIDKNTETIERLLGSDSGNLDNGRIDPATLKNITRYTDLEECLQREDVDAVFICVHTDLHYPMAKKALQSNKHVLIEKPFCLDIEKATELITIAEDKERILMVAHVVRFMPPYQKLKQWIDSKEFGNLKFLSFSRFCGVPSWGEWKNAEVRNNSGGALFDLAIHDMDFCNYVLGSPTTVSCNYLPGELSRHDYISAWWTYKDKNIEVKIESGNIFHAKFPFQAGFTAYFEEATVLYTSQQPNIIRIADYTHLREVDAGNVSAGYCNEIDYFAECMETGNYPAVCSPVSSLQSIQLCYNNIN
jgi:predicted dehydrogenase